MSGINSAERILAILDVFTEDRLEWTPEELMAKLGYSRPTLYRYLKSLREAGFLSSIPNAGFTLGPRVVEMDYLMRKSDRLVLNGQPFLEQLTASYPCSALLVRWYGAKLLCVASECSTPDPVSSYPRGRPMPLARGAISRAIMAHLPRRQLLPLIAENLSELTAIGIGGDTDEILAGMRQVRRQGFALAHGEVTPGVFGIAAPVFDAGNTPIAAIAATLRATDISPGRLEAVCADIRHSGLRLSGLLGDVRQGDDTAGQDDTALRPAETPNSNRMILQ